MNDESQATPRKSRFRIERLEERIAPSVMYTTCKPCGGKGGSQFQSQSHWQAQWQAQSQHQHFSFFASIKVSVINGRFFFAAVQ